jgi:formylglycine-generating enzyme required for sulfatase activity
MVQTKYRKKISTPSFKLVRSYIYAAMRESIVKLTRALLLSALAFSTIQTIGQTNFSHYEFNVPGSSFKMSMRAIKGGTFLMGSDQKGSKVTLSDFWIGTYEVTHDQFSVFFKDESFAQGSKVDAITRPTAQYIDLSWGMGKEGGFPVNSMSVDGALMFCRWLYQKTGVFYRLPTEAEWEYACASGSKSTYPFGDDPAQLADHAWYILNSGEKYQKTGTLKPNAWGIHDMLGNVAEWTLDQYDEDYFSTIGPEAKDPVIPPKTRYPRSFRGGSFQDPVEFVSPTYRRGSDISFNQRDPQVPKSRWWLTDGAYIGFRILCPRQQPTKEEAEKFYTLYLGK